MSSMFFATEHNSFRWRSEFSSGMYIGSSRIFIAAEMFSRNTLMGDWTSVFSRAQTENVQKNIKKYGYQRLVPSAIMCIANMIIFISNIFSKTEDILGKREYTL